MLLVMRAYSPDGFAVPLPEHHRFPMRKYAPLRERVAGAGLATICDPPAATDEEILRAHGAKYLRKLVDGTLTRDEERAIGLPWSEQLVPVGATARLAVTGRSPNNRVNRAA